MQRRDRCFGCPNVNNVAIAMRLAHPNVASWLVQLSSAAWTMKWPSLLRVKPSRLTLFHNVSLLRYGGNNCTNRQLESQHRTWQGCAVVPVADL